MPGTHHDLPPSQHFALEQLAEGVFAAIALDSGHAIGNAGIIDLGDSTLVFDTFITPAAARDLKTAAGHLTGKPVRFVVNSHYHNDHIRGNQVFNDNTTIIATNATRHLLQTDGEEELKWDTEFSAIKAVEFAAQLAVATDDQTRANLTLWHAYFDGIARSLGELQIRLPDLTFDANLTLHGSSRKVEIISHGGGHTKSDAFLFLPDDGIAFVSDLLFVDCHPFLADGNPRELLAYIERLQQFDLTATVPGHGPVGTMQHLQDNADYINAAMEIARQSIAAGQTADEAGQSPVPEPFKTWRFSNFFATNLRFLHRFLSES